MNHVIVGTAGHVDHGKTMLIKALSGIDTDRLKEEKKRGITIELGFAHLDLPDGQTVGIVDVPGHEKFVKNMLAGAGGIDIALLIVAADEGFMPQTREHLGILSLLDIPQGIIVITKKDLVDDEWLEMLIEDTKEEVKGTFLADAPILCVSAQTGEGIEDLRREIARQAALAPPKNLKIPFRLPIDRVFSIDGFGTVVTGTLTQGQMEEGADVMIYPEGRVTKIRNLQVHSHTVQQAYAGQRVAVNLANIKKSELSRGDTLAKPNSMDVTHMIDVRLEVLADSARSIENHSRLHFYHGARDILCKVVLLDRETLEPGQSCYAQLRFTDPVAVKRKDRFVVRFYSPIETIGGGVILEGNPRRHKRFDPAVLQELSIKESGSVTDKLLQALVDHAAAPVPVSALEKQLELSEEEEASTALLQLVEQGQAAYVTDQVVLAQKTLDELASVLEQALEKYHRENPLQAGMKVEQTRPLLLKGKDPALCDAILGRLAEDGRIQLAAGRVAKPGFAVVFSPKHQRIRERLLTLYREGKFAPPQLDELYQSEFAKDAAAAKQVVEALVSSGELVLVSAQIAFLGEYYAQALSMLQDFVQEHGSISLAQFRDLLGTSRKYALSLLEYWDRQKVTKKQGEDRVLAEQKF